VSAWSDIRDSVRKIILMQDKTDRLVITINPLVRQARAARR
jgi:hypothetical protein